jgi:hypothetical protein
VYRMTAVGTAVVNAIRILNTTVLVARLSLLDYVQQVSRMMPRGYISSLCLVRQIQGQLKARRRGLTFSLDESGMATAATAKVKRATIDERMLGKVV